MTRSVYADPTSGVQHSIETLYQPCSKDRKEVFLTKDGPLFKLKDGVTSYPDNPMVLVGLQELRDRVKLLLILRWEISAQMEVAPQRIPKLDWILIKNLVFLENLSLW